MLNTNNGILDRKRLKTLRINKGLSQEELGKMIGVSKSTICCYELGTRVPSLENVVSIMLVFGVSADYLLGKDHKIMTIENNQENYHFLSREEIQFIEELRKDKTVYDILLDDPKRGATVVINRVG